jgi:hypothetical protein
MEEHGLKGSLGMADALVAATAVENGLDLCTGNVKHFRILPDVKLSTFVG